VHRNPVRVGERRVGVVAHTDDASGYRYHRAPDALQELFTCLIRKSSASWERRFQLAYYDALFHLFGWQYRGRPEKPPVIGQITRK